MIKKLFLAILALVVLLSAGLFAFLLPAHLQVREASKTDIPTIEKIRTATNTDNGPVALRYLLTSKQQLPENTLAHSVFVIEWANGDLFMIDAGMTPPRAIEFGRMLESVLGAGETETIGSISELLGENIHRVRGVGFTHLHIDHVQAVSSFCDATGSPVSLLQSSLQASEHNHVTEEGAGIILDSCLQPDSHEGGLITSDRFPGLVLIPVGGHTPGSTAFAVTIDNQTYLMSGDITNSKQEIRQGRGKGAAYSYLLVPEDTGRTAELRRWLAELETEGVVVIVSHDLEDIVASGITHF